ncbi:hypothetical protein [uncultured Hymenobacter sp.]|uniref:hypothetical protein n=1 Tax=uncultured Hymenobacter sp. TaxID=170016 RepID=UPI0035C9F0CF
MSDSPDNPHPLDEALRRHLSSYGETPSPQVWASVRAQLPGQPTAGPMPRWRRPARRLSLLLGLLLGLLLSLGAGVWLLTDPVNPLARRPGPLATKRSQPTDAQRRPLLATAQPNLTAGSNSGQSDADLATSLPPAEREASPEAAPGALTHPNKQLRAAKSAAKAPLGQAGLMARARLRPGALGPLTAPGDGSAQTASRAALSTLSKRPTRRPGNSPTPPTLPEAAASGSAGQPAPESDQAAVTARTLRPTAPETPGTAGSGTPSLGPDDEAEVNEAEPLPTTQSPAQLPLAERLASRQVAMLQAGPLGTRPEALALPLDSAGPPAAAKRRRWALQAVAGPTLSYRTLRQPWRAGPAELTQLERPGLGWGAQVQLRRVLSGRWALAAGLGFQQYATQSAQVESSSNVSYVVWRAASTVAPRRDTYNLLVAPVQVSYALGSFGPRWQVAAVAGIEPGRYLGGRSAAFGNASALDNISPPAASPTPNGMPTSFNFGQRTYTGAETSPYRAWNLGLSLGLDLRYRLGPASRWQLLAQPTVRGLVSPFAQANAPDYSRRPFSLGGLAGLSWDVH